jgi:hypothetical protein
LAAKAAIKQVFPDFENTWIKKAEKQVVAGWNIFVTFSYPNSSETY